jgi:hypothetical protein
MLTRITWRVFSLGGRISAAVKVMSQYSSCISLLFRHNWALLCALPWVHIAAGLVSWQAAETNMLPHLTVTCISQTWQRRTRLVYHFLLVFFRAYNHTVGNCRRNFTTCTWCFKTNSTTIRKDNSCVATR